MSYLDGRRSGFPYNGKIDQILELFDLPISQKANAIEYKELKTKANLTTTEKNRLNALTVSLQHYIIDVEKWNYFGDVIINIQNHYLNETVGFIDDLQTQANQHLAQTESFMAGLKTETRAFVEQRLIDLQTEINQKSASLQTEIDKKTIALQTEIDKRSTNLQAEVDKINYRGEWKPATQYYAKNIVTSGGEGFIAKTDGINQPPPNETYWGKITTKGEKGDPSLNINYKGEYNVGTPYVMGDAVTFGGMWYYAKKNTSGNQPTNATYWELQTNQTAVGTVEPFDNRVNLWIDISK